MTRASTQKYRISALPAHYPIVTYYRRHLPHWQPSEVPIFLTWRLYGSLPRHIDSRAASPGDHFRAIDRQLDRATTGPTWLRRPKVATCVADTLSTGTEQWKLYDLFAWVVMSNHVHVLLRPHRALRQVTRAVKSASARQANSILERSGSPFWQDESYDHWVRDSKEFEQIVQYIERNPVHAGLVERVEDWPWSSAYPKS